MTSPIKSIVEILKQTNDSQVAYSQWVESTDKKDLAKLTLKNWQSIGKTLEFPSDWAQKRFAAWSIQAETEGDGSDPDESEDNQTEDNQTEDNENEDDGSDPDESEDDGTEGDGSDPDESEDDENEDDENEDDENEDDGTNQDDPHPPKANLKSRKTKK